MRRLALIGMIISNLQFEGNESEILFKKLRGKLKEMDIDQKYLAKFFDLSQASISHRLTNHISWTLDEMYAVMDLILEPYELLNEYFPKGGRDNQPISRSHTRAVKNRPEEKYRAELIEIAFRIMFELDGKKYEGII